MWGIFPHTHVRGRSGNTLELPDGTARSRPLGAELRLQLADLLHVQGAAADAEGLAARVARVTTTRRRTNRTRIRRSTSKWGDQTWEEMSTGLLFSPVRPATTTTASKSSNAFLGTPSVGFAVVLLVVLSTGAGPRSRSDWRHGDMTGDISRLLACTMRGVPCRRRTRTDAPGRATRRHGRGTRHSGRSPVAADAEGGTLRAATGQFANDRSLTPSKLR